MIDVTSNYRILFTTAGLLSVCSVLKDRLDGLWSRALNAGVSENELLVAHVISQVILTLIQLVFILTAIVLVFKMKNHGSNFTVISLMIMIQFAGTTFGIAISVLSKGYITANNFLNGVIGCSVYFCGKNC